MLSSYLDNLFHRDKFYLQTVARFVNALGNIYGHIMEVWVVGHTGHIGHTVQSTAVANDGKSKGGGENLFSLLMGRYLLMMLFIDIF